MAKSITMRIDGDLKKKADETLEEIGLTMTTYFITSLKALIREQRVPFDLSTKQYNNALYEAKLNYAVEDAKSHGVYEYLGKDKDGKALFSETPQEATL
jgi:DNA-damage-inducible protein J